MGRLIGRKSDLDALEELFSQGHRLVVVVGPPGVGKTRLGQGFGQIASQSHGWRVASCSLADVHSVDEFVAVVRSGLSLDALVPQGLPPHLALTGMDQDDVLLVLDNMEHLVSQTDQIVAQWLDTAPGLRVLVTSRQRLSPSIPAHCHELKPLRVPTTTSDTEDSPAVELFVHRAQQVRASFALSGPERAWVAQLVRLLDGLPLAIEIAASRMGVLGPKDLLDRFLDQGARSDVLETALDRSWNLLEPDEQAALAQCSVFRGGFTAHAAEAVISVAGTCRSVLDLLQSLRDRSLLQAEHPVGSVRLSMHLFVRSFASTKLAAAERMDLRERHALYYLGGEGSAISGEYDNVVAALDLRRTTSSGLGWLRCLLAAAPVVMAHGPILPFLVQLDEALEKTGLQPNSELVRALQVRAAAKRASGDMAGALRDIERARVIAHQIADKQAELIALADEGGVRAAIGDEDMARRQLDQVLSMVDAIPAPVVEQNACITVGWLLVQREQPEDALAVLQRALSSARRTHNTCSEAQALATMGLLEFDRGDLDAAQRLLSRSLALLAPGPRRLRAYVHAYLALVAHDSDSFDRAAQLYDLALREIAPYCDLRGESWLLACKCALACHSNIPEAERLLRVATGHAESCGDPQALWAVKFLSTELDIARARMGQPGAIAAAQRKIHEATDGPDAPARRSWDVRFAIRLALRSLSTLQAPDELLEVAADGSWFRVGSGDRVDLGKHRSLRLLLIHLAQVQSLSPGKACSLHDLLAAGWPDEHLHPLAGSNRLHVALTKLRKLGLASIISRTDCGYLINPKIRVEINNADVNWGRSDSAG